MERVTLDGISTREQGLDKLGTTGRGQSEVMSIKVRGKKGTVLYVKNHETARLNLVEGEGAVGEGGTSGEGDKSTSARGGVRRDRDGPGGHKMREKRQNLAECTVDLLEMEDINQPKHGVKVEQLPSKGVVFKGKEGAGVPSCNTERAKEGRAARGKGLVRNPTVPLCGQWRG